MLKKLWDVLGGILAIVLVVTYALLILNANFAFISGDFLKTLDIIRTYGSLALIGIVGLEAVSRRCLIIKIIYLLLCAIIVIFLFFPDTYQNLIGAIA
ncbi:MAG: hypothetical protein IKA11_01610 [Clostridia bacterium]|nr:hypothetical protein [Clostridia bacterium]